MIERPRHLNHIHRLLRENPVVAILGARQVGKTTLARQLAERFAGPIVRFDLEDPDDLARLAEPKLALERLHGLIVIDEVQRRPDLFQVLRVLVDRPGHDARWLVLG
ncbi:MAG: AAA family ATPase, partial [Longimicrobiales bacterium]